MKKERHTIYRLFMLALILLLALGVALLIWAMSPGGGAPQKNWYVAL